MNILNRVFFLLTITAVPAFAQQKNENKKPNIIFILTDDLGYGDVGVFYQQQREKAKDKSEPWMYTPHLDRLADNGAQLTHQYCPAPVCAPSRASLMLGQNQGHANVRDNQFDKALENNYTMASVLHTAGYATAAIGKWGLQGSKKWDKNGDKWPAHPLNRGFDYFFGYIRHGDGHEHYPKEGVYRGPKEVWENRTELSDKLDKCYTADLWTAVTKKWIVEHQKKAAGEPFFIYLAYDTPHAVLELPTQPYPSGGGLNGGLQWTGRPGQMINTASGKPDSWMHPDYAHAVYDHDKNPSTPEISWPETYKRYAASVRRIDSGVGDIMELLKDLKIDSNTIIVFTSDNGPSVESYLPESYVRNTPDFFNGFGPFDGVKRDLWEGGVRVPSMVAWPARIPAGQVSASPSAFYDWLPTFADAAGLPAPARTDGVSLLPSLTGKGKQQKSTVYVEYFNNTSTPSFEEFDPKHRSRKRNQMQLIRIGDTVGVRYDIQSHQDNFEIYNVVKDPQQTKNLAANPGMDAVQKLMKAKVLQVRRPDSTAPRPYDNELVPAVSKSKKLQKGVKWSSYTGDFPWIPDVKGLKPAASGKASQPGIETAPKSSVLFFEGYIRIPADGAYGFHLNVSGNALLRIHDALVIDADYGYKSGKERSGKMLLKAGLHPFRLYYKTSAGNKPMLDFQWDGPGIARHSVPAEVFYRD